MSADLARADPFALTAHADAYVPRAATDRAFEQLERGVLAGARPVALAGPAGLGKTLLLQRLVARVGDRLFPVYLPYASLGPDELCGWTLAVLNAEPTDDPIGVFRAYLRHLRESDAALLLVIDDASVLPLATARWLARLAESSGGALRVALAAGDSPASDRKLDALGESVDVIRLTEPMNAEETRQYLAARLDAVDATAPSDASTACRAATRAA
jgi:type II secretory pathway predicted ATPase ExeA